MTARRTAAAPRAAAQEWRANWGLILAGILGISFVAVPAVTLGIYMEPLQKEFGWSRAEISFGMTIYALVSTPLAPFAGALADRFGSRRIVLPGLILNGLAFAAFALLTGSLWLYALLWMVFAITQLAIRSTNWNRAASAAFSTSRGLALAIMMLGIPIAQTLAPIVTEALIGEHGWRTGFAAVGIGWTAITFIVCLLLFREPQDRKLPTGQAQAAAAPQGGLSIAEALRNPRMWRIALAILLQSALSTAMTVHLFPLLTESGASRSGAANIVALLGISALAGQLVTGFLADRVKSTVLPVSCFILPVIAYPLLMQGEGSPALLSLGVVLAGFSATATMTMTVYMTTRYAGIHHFGKIYGAISACMGLGSGIGPPLAGAIFDRTGSYDNYLLIGVPVALASGLLVLRLGAYPNFGSSHKATASAGNEED